MIKSLGSVASKYIFLATALCILTTDTGFSQIVPSDGCPPENFFQLRTISAYELKTDIERAVDATLSVVSSSNPTRRDLLTIFVTTQDLPKE